MFSQHIVRSMGGGLVPALVKEVLRNGRSAVHCQAILCQLVQVGRSLLKYGTKYYCDDDGNI